MATREPNKELLAEELVERARAHVIDALKSGLGYAEVFRNVLRSPVWLRAQRAVELHMGFFAFFKPGSAPPELHYQTGYDARANLQDFSLPFHRADEPIPKPL